MGKLTIEQAKKIMEAVKNAETNPVENKFYPESKTTTADKIDMGKTRKMPAKTNRMPKVDRSFLNKGIKFEKPKIFNPKNVPEFKRPKPFNPNEMSEGRKYKYVGSSSMKKLKSGGDADACGCESCMGGTAKGAGAAIRGTNFKGIF